MSCSDSATKFTSAPNTPTRHQVTPYIFQRYRQLRFQISHKITEGFPTDTQDYISSFCYEIIAMTVSRVISTSSNGLGKSWDPVWVPYHYGFDGTYPIPLYKKGIRTKELTKDTLSLLWNSGRCLLDRASFGKWDNDGTGRAKPRNVNVQFLVNGLDEDINTFWILFQEIIQTYSSKAQVYKVKL